MIIRRKHWLPINIIGIILITVAGVPGCGKNSNEKSNQPAANNDLDARLTEAMESWRAATGIATLDDIQARMSSCGQEPNAADAHSLLFREMQALDSATRSFLRKRPERLSPIELDRGLSPYHGLIEDIRKACMIECCQWYSDLTQNARTFEYSAYVESARRFLLLEAAYQSQLGEPARALEFVEAVFHLAKQVRSDPVAACLSSGMSMESAARMSASRILMKHDLPADRIAALLETRDYAAELTRAAAAEGVIVITGAKQKYNVAEDAPLRASDFPESVAVEILEFLENMQSFIAGAREPVCLQKNVSPFEFPDAWHSKKFNIDWLLKTGKFDVTQDNTSRVMLLFALQIRRARAETGTYPLAEEIEIPIDPAVGEPFIYLVSSTGGFIIRSPSSFHAEVYDIDDTPYGLELRWD